MSEFNVRVIENITKDYPDMFKIVIYKEPRVFVKSNSVKRREKDVDHLSYVPKISSLNRTKTLIKDLVLCNEFDYFCTFTFDPSKVDRFSFPACYSKMSGWLSHQRDNSREKGIEFKYLLIPEQHKSGAWHFHALISGYTGFLKPSKAKTNTLRPIFNITSFRSGFTTAVVIDSKESVSTYVTKYITKDFIKKFNQRRFFCSRNLVRPEKYINSSVFSNTLPLFRRKVYEGDNTQEFLIDKMNYV